MCGVFFPRENREKFGTKGECEIEKSQVRESKLPPVNLRWSGTMI